MEFYRSRSVSDAESLPDSTGSFRIVPDTLTPQERVIIDYLDQNDRVTTLEIAGLLSISDRRVRQVVKRMIDQGLLEKRGSARSTFYVRPGNE